LEHRAAGQDAKFVWRSRGIEDLGFGAAQTDPLRIGSSSAPKRNLARHQFIVESIAAIRESQSLEPRDNCAAERRDRRTNPSAPITGSPIGNLRNPASASLVGPKPPSLGLWRLGPGAAMPPSFTCVQYLRGGKSSGIASKKMPERVITARFVGNIEGYP